MISNLQSLLSGGSPALLGLRNETLTRYGSSIAALRQQQAATGFNLRHDILTNEQEMSAYPSEAKKQLNAQDGKATERSLKAAERSIEHLEGILRQ